MRKTSLAALSLLFIIVLAGSVMAPLQFYTWNPKLKQYDSVGYAQTNDPSQLDNYKQRVKDDPSASYKVVTLDASGKPVGNPQYITSQGTRGNAAVVTADPNAQAATTQTASGVTVQQMQNGEWVNVGTYDSYDKVPAQYQGEGYQIVPSGSAGTTVPDFYVPPVEVMPRPDGWAQMSPADQLAYVNQWEVTGTGPQTPPPDFAQASTASAPAPTAGGTGAYTVQKMNPDTGKWENYKTYDSYDKIPQDELGEGYQLADNSGGPGTTGANAQAPAGKSTKDIGVGATISDFMKNEYGNIASLGGMMLGNALSDWKKTVDDAFCKTVVLGGQQCWLAKICGSSPTNAGGDGTLVTQHFGANDTLVMQFIAHIEGERLEGAVNGTNVQYLYKITYAIRNPDKDEANGFLVRFFSEGGSYDWWGPEIYQSFYKGQYIVAAGDTTLAAYSTTLYTRVCLIFQKIVSVSGEETRQVCNNIVTYAGTATTPYRAANATTTTATPGKTPPPPGGAGF